MIIHFKQHTVRVGTGGGNGKWLSEAFIQRHEMQSILSDALQFLLHNNYTAAISIIP